MMHGVDQDMKIVKVNPRWLDRMDYVESEVIGHRSTEFLAEGSRTRALEEIIPLFLHFGSYRGAGMQFITSEGQTLDVLVDAEVTNCDCGNVYAYAAIYDAHDHEQWEQAATTMKALRRVAGIQCEIAAGTLLGGVEGAPGVLHPSGLVVEAHMRNPSDSPPLTRRELEVLGLLVLGLGNKEIAERLTLATRTVKFHIEHLYQKLSVQSRIQAAQVAIERGLLNS